MKETRTYPTVSVIIRGCYRERNIGRAVIGTKPLIQEHFSPRRGEFDG